MKVLRNEKILVKYQTTHSHRKIDKIPQRGNRNLG
jgi:hypothetical protein